MTAPIRPAARIVDLLKHLIGFRTVSQTANADLIDFIEDHFTRLGARTFRVSDETDGRTNLFATLGPDIPGGVVLSGHTDVVPVTGQDWRHDPFEAVLRDGRIFGRGACDMKGFLACAMALAERIDPAGLSVPLHFAFSYDEEVGCIGVRSLVRRLNDLPHRPAMCIVGEPTGMQVVTQHKGMHSAVCTVKGKSAHSSLPGDGVNAIDFAAELVVWLRALNKRFSECGPFDDGFDPPHTTVHTGMIAGGQQLNIVPEKCSFEYEYRTLPGHDAAGIEAEMMAYVRETLEPEMTARDPAAGIDFAVSASFPGLGTGDDEEVARLVMELTGANRTAKVSFATEAGIFSRQGGIPSVVCGPGSIVQAHKPDEYVSLDQLARCERFLADLGERLSAGC